MYYLRIQSAKAIFWLTAIFVAAQPILSFSCPCICRMHDKAINVERNASSCCSHGVRCSGSNQHHSCVATTALNHLPQAYQLGRCPCGKDCACWIQHEASIGMMTESRMNLRDSLDRTLLFADVTFYRQISDFELSLINLTPHHHAQEGTALEIGARFCRFNI